MEDVTTLLKIVSMLDNKVFNQLTNTWKDNIKYIFPNIKDNEVINAYLNQDEDEKLYISIYLKNSNKIKLLVKNNNYIHEENYYDFFSYLFSINLSSSTLRIFSYYHFCYVTKIDERIKLSKKELLKEYEEYIQLANKEINQEENLKNILLRFYKMEKEDTYIYFVNENKLFSYEKLYDFIKTDNISKSYIHFGNLKYKPNLLRLNKLFYDYSKIKINLK
jgi:sRNA-binding regulator protein Hfq